MEVGWRGKWKGISSRNLVLVESYKIHESSQLLLANLQKEKWKVELNVGDK